MSVYEVSELNDNSERKEMKKILSRLALLGIFIPSHVSDKDILDRYDVKELEQTLEDRKIDYSWLLEQEAISERGNIESIPPPVDLEQEIAGPYGLTEPYIGGFTLVPNHRRDYPYKESEKGDEFLLANIRWDNFSGENMAVYNRRTLIRLLMAMGYFYFEGDVGSATRLVDWDLKHGQLTSKVPPGTYDRYMRAKSYLSAQLRENLILLFKRRLASIGGNNAEYVLLKNVPLESMTKDMLIPSLLNADSIFSGLNEREIYREGSLYRGPILPEDDINAFKGDSEEAIGNRYRRSISFKVATLKLFESVGIRTGGFDETVYAIISKSQRFFLIAMLTEYLLQKAKPLARPTTYFDKDFKSVEDLGGIDNLNLEQMISLADPYITPDTANFVLSIIGDIPLKWNISIFKQITDYFVKYLLTTL